MSQNVNILVITHDAGGANIIAWYVKKHLQRKSFRAYVAGPAKKIFKSLTIPFSNAPKTRQGIAALIAKHRPSLVLTATGWMTSIERFAWLEAERQGIRCAVYLDSWGNYRERFDFPKVGWQKNLPQEFWMGDKYAFKSAKMLFPHARVRLVPNEYFKHIITQYRARGSARGKQVLFMSDIAPHVAEALDEFLAHLSPEQQKLGIRLRFHPADARKRYDELIRKYRKLVRIEKSNKQDIVEDLIRARVIVGTETAGLVAGLLVGKKTICLGHYRKEAFLPYAGLIRVRHPRSAARLI